MLFLCTLLPPGAFKVYQTHKFRSYTVISGSLRASKVDQKILFSVKWLNFANFRGSWSETVYPREFIMNYKVVYNVISDHFHFDHKTVRSNLTKLFS